MRGNVKGQQPKRSPHRNDDRSPILRNSRRDLEHEFMKVRKVYFPRWDKAHRWRCRFLRAKMARVGCHGLCDPEGKIVYVG
jgi:hypothetical protein